MKILCKNKHWKLNEDYDLNKILYLLVDRPFCNTEYNSFYWIIKCGEVTKDHRNYDLPSYISNNAFVVWRKNNNFHRDNNKPAIIRFDGSKEYFIYDKFIKEEK